MVSEYALGRHKWLLTLFFICWGLCNFSAGVLLWDVVSSGWSKFGVILIFITGIGAIMGGLYDVQHKLHGLSSAIGMPFLPVGALLISYHLVKKSIWQDHTAALMFSSHAIWISMILMAGSMFLLFSSLKAAGVVFGPDSAPMMELPKGVIGLNGWANRLLIFCYIFYPVLIAKLFLSLSD